MPSPASPPAPSHPVNPILPTPVRTGNRRCPLCRSSKAPQLRTDGVGGQEPTTTVALTKGTALGDAPQPLGALRTAVSIATAGLFPPPGGSCRNRKGSQPGEHSPPPCR